MDASPKASITSKPRAVGRYLLFEEIAAGGMATVHLARLVGPVGFARTVAIKQMHPHLASDARVRSMFIDEARMAARVRHPNTVAVLDVIVIERDLLLVMDYVHGESLARLVAAKPEDRRAFPVPIASAILIGVLHGLHAAHEAKDEKGQPLGLVHRDVSPQNILVGLDGVSRVVDFGIAKAAGRLQTTADGQLKGKAAYIAPEQIIEGAVDRRADVYAASVVLWELLAGRRLFDGQGVPSTLRQVLDPKLEAPSHYAASVPSEVDRVVMKGLAFDPDQRFASAWDMAAALEKAAPAASVREISEWVEAVAGETLRGRAKRVADIESASPPSELSPIRKPGESQDRISTMPGSLSASTPPPADLNRVSITTLARPLVARDAHAKRFAAAAIALGAVFLGAFAMVGARGLRPKSPPPSDPPAAPAPGPSAPITSMMETTPSAIPSPATPRPPAPASAKPKALRRAPSRVAGTNCAVPFTWSQDGTKVPKPECL